jgi:hypothetical protein
MSVSDSARPSIPIEGPALETLWATLKPEAERIVAAEPILGAMLRRSVLDRSSFPDALAL